MKQTAKCVFCHRVIEEDNIGIVILGKCICASCEQKVTNLAWDDPEYDVYKSGVKKIWRFNEA